MKKSIKFILALIVAACAIVGALFFFGDEPVNNVTEPTGPVDIVVSMNIVAEKPFQAQIFWTEDEMENFNEKQSVRKEVPAGESVFELLIPTDIVHSFRFDFGREPGTVTVSDVKLSGIEPATLDLNQFKRFNDIESHDVQDGRLTITSTARDPYMVYALPIDVTTD